MIADAELTPPVAPTPIAAVDQPDRERRAVATSAVAFPQSVSSGGPSPRGVVLWTRIAPSVYEPDVPLTVVVARDRQFTERQYEGGVPAEEISPDRDWTVRVDLEGELAPDRQYYYRFEYAGTKSRIGRCRTLPAPDSSPTSIRFAVLCCQHYQNGYFPAYHHVAEEDVDFVVHLGDFIYETAGDQYKGLGSRSYPGRAVELPSGRDVVWGLEDFRYLYRTYLSDEFLQETLERHTLIRGWDDHAIANNRYWDYEADAPVAPNHPMGRDPAFMRQLTVEGIKAWWEYTPARVEYDPDASHLHEMFRLWRSFEFGDLATLVMTDERLFRTEPLCAGTILPKWAPVCSVSEDPERTMLGSEQLGWFVDELHESESVWTVWGNEVLSLPLRLGVGPLSIYPKTDSWDGYATERDRITSEVRRGGVRNFVTITGDMHSYVAGYQRLSYPDWLRARLTDPEERAAQRVGVELMTPAVSSVNIAEAVGVGEGRLGALSERLLRGAVRRLVPHVEFFDSHYWGYSVVELTPDDCTYRAYSVDKRVNGRDAPRTLLAAFRVPEGRVELQSVSTDEPSGRPVTVPEERVAADPVGESTPGERLHRFVELGQGAGLVPPFRPPEPSRDVDIGIDADTEGREDERIERQEH